MRKLILAAAVLALTAVTAYTAGGALIGTPTDPAQQPQVRSGGVGANPQGGFLGGYERLAKGDMSGTGPGAGGHMGAMKGGKKGGQHGKQ